MTRNSYHRARHTAVRCHNKDVVTAEGLESRVFLAVTPFDVPVQSSGTTPVNLYPIESVTPGVVTRVSFGVPFAKGFVTDVSRVRLLDAAGAEVSVFAQQLTPWRDLSLGADLPSARSVQLQADVRFPDSDGDGDADPVRWTVEWGRTARTLPGLLPVSARSNWVLYNNAAAPAGTDYTSANNVYEPPAYALFTPDWYGQSQLKSRLLPFGSEPASAFYESALANFGKTAVNDVDPRVTGANKIHFITDYDPWLFDRATALYQLAFRSGSIQFLREAHRASQFYANHISADGTFDLRAGDMKYVYGESISTDYWLTGDDRLPAVHRRMIPAFDGFEARYTLNTGFWTERHAAFKLLGYVTGFELLGDPAIAQKARTTFDTYLNHQNNPVAGAPNTGMLMHTSASHGEGDGEFIASPWMTTLLVDAVERYYEHSGDARVGGFVIRIADGMNRINESMYYASDWESPTPVLVPYYLAGPNLTAAQHDQDSYSDVEHAVDVSKIFALAYFFSGTGGSPNAVYLGRFNELSDTARQVFDYWHRPGGPASGLTEYRLSPPRKFNWWFRTTAENDFLVRPRATDAEAPRATPAVSDVTAGGGASYTFSVTYTDNVAVKVASIGNGDVLVSGPNGFSQAAVLVSVDNPADGSPRTATYRVTAPGGTWDYADSGAYTVRLAPSAVTDTVGNAAAAGQIASFNVSIANPDIPTATGNTSAATCGWTVHWFTVTYADDQALDCATIGAGDVVVTGANGFSQAAVLSNLVVSSDHRQATVTYRISAPGGSWDRADNGTYLVNLQPAQVADARGNYVAAGVVGSITAQMADVTAPVAGAATLAYAGTACHWFTVTYTDEQALNDGTIDGNDLVVTGPNGFTADAALSNLTASSDGRSWTATYRVNAPGGSWDAADNGTYTLSLRPAQVADASGNFAAAGTLGSFAISEPAAVTSGAKPATSTSGATADVLLESSRKDQDVTA